MLPGSVSKYCLQHSPVPVIVVRPSSKRDKARSKRANDPNRLGYQEMLAKSESLIDVTTSPAPSPRGSFVASDEQAAAVKASLQAQSAQYTQPVEPSPLAQVHHAEQSEDETFDKDPRSPGSLLKSPELQNLDSPDISSDSSSDDEDGAGGVSTRTRNFGSDEAVGETVSEANSAQASAQPYEPIQFQPFQPASAAELAASRAAANEREAAYTPPEQKPKADHRSAAQRIMEGV